MKIKKMIVGLASMCLILGVSATVIYANEDKKYVEANMTSTIEVFESGAMETEVEGVEMNKEILEDNISAEIQLVDEVNHDIEGKEMLTKEIISE